MIRNPTPNSTALAPPGDSSNADFRAKRGRAAVGAVAGVDRPSRAGWAAPTPSAKVEFLEADTRIGGREVSLCKVEGQSDIRCECGWLELRPTVRSVNYEVISSEGATQSAALITADFADLGERSRLVVTVQLSSLAGEMEGGYRQGFAAGLDNLASAAERTMVLQKLIRAPRAVVWNAWMNPETLPLGGDRRGSPVAPGESTCARAANGSSI